MATLTTQGISLYYELLGNPANPPVLLIAGLGGVGTSWGPQIERFAAKYHVIVPDQRGTGRTTRAADGYTTEQIAADRPRWSGTSAGDRCTSSGNRPAARSASTWP